MPDEPIEPREHYVYALYREDGVTPFYIGMGKGRRWLAHDKPKDADRSPKASITRKVIRICGFLPRAKLSTGLTVQEAFAMEVRLIAEYGRIPNGPLANFTAGGEGVSDHPPESRAKQSEANRRAWADPEKRVARLASIAAAKAAWTPEKREEMRLKSTENLLKAIEAVRAKPRKIPKPNYIRKGWTKESRALQESARQRAVESARSPQANEKRAASMRRYWEDPSRRANVKKVDWTPERRRQASEFMSSPEMRQKLSSSQNAASRAKQSVTMKDVLKTPEMKAKWGAASKAKWAANKQEILQKRAATRAANKTKKLIHQS